MSQRPALWIFCRVIDNFGDAGVCWRLARQMADEHWFAVSLFIDLPETLKPLAPELRLRANGLPGKSPDDAGEPSRTPGDRPINPWTRDALRVIHWVDGDEAAMLALAHPEPVTVISGFGCELPAGVRAGLGSGARGGPVWVDFEYLSAEDWVESFHGRASPKPGDSAVAHYFSPASPR